MAPVMNPDNVSLGNSLLSLSWTWVTIDNYNSNRNRTGYFKPKTKNILKIWSVEQNYLVFIQKCVKENVDFVFCSFAWNICIATLLGFKCI